jgi:hypothetical protein
MTEREEGEMKPKDRERQAELVSRARHTGTLHLLESVMKHDPRRKGQVRTAEVAAEEISRRTWANDKVWIEEEGRIIDPRRDWK